MSNRGKACQCFPSKLFSAACLPRCPHLSACTDLRVPVFRDLLSNKGRGIVRLTHCWCTTTFTAAPGLQNDHISIVKVFFCCCFFKARELRAVFIWEDGFSELPRVLFNYAHLPLTLLHRPYFKDISGWKEFTEGGPDSGILKTPTEESPGWTSPGFSRACRAIICLLCFLLILESLLSPLLGDFLHLNNAAFLSSSYFAFGRPDAGIQLFI